MFGALALGIGLGIVFVNNQAAGAGGTPPSSLHYIQQDGSDFVQQNGTSLFLEN